jgi:hypothetical protein
MIFSPRIEKASSGVHSAFLVGFDIAKIAGLEEDESFNASKT